MIKYASVCSGVEAPSLAWEGLNWSPQWFSEIEDFPSAVLKKHWPSVPNLGDMLKLNEHEVYNESKFDLLVGGTPCQSFSTAGQRGGLQDPRGQLSIEFCNILSVKRPKWFIWENVPGVFSSSKGQDLRAILSKFTEIGYGISWRVLDAQFFGVPQRRKRIFVVGYYGDWRPSRTILFEPEILHRPDKKVTRSKQKIARPIGDTSLEAGIWRKLKHHSYVVDDVGSTLLNRADGVGDLIPWSKSGRDNGKKEFRVSPHNGVANTLNTGDGCGNQSTINLVMHPRYVRKPSPLEAERLQGMPDNHTLIDYKKGQSPDGLRYEAIGNSIAVPVLKEIGERINEYEKRNINSYLL